MKNIEVFKQAIVRFISISGTIILLAYIVYYGDVFIPTHWPFQFLVSGVTIGLSYAAFREKYTRQGTGLLTLWYVVLLGSVGQWHEWIFILEGIYITVISLGVYFIIRILQKPMINNAFLRIGTSMGVLAIANSLIIVILGFFSLSHFVSQLQQEFDAMSLNLKVGAMLGLFMGIGVELSDSFVSPMFLRKRVAS